ncbi:acetoacetate--CoA ligase [Tianweitania sediminis]|uniref:Acetoacetate--CoA ligase n=1 Tax=Tianweitania sediminis TaxID=1502156 RepID=A0A8J7R1M8_9HYPH|nr:acetoacetate--CoA ligase [Tianweitania sediminis]MBP0438565.1 acetoacetate--CoA ligase [Tianweitania sediminis]
MTSTQPLWTPSRERIEHHPMTRFMAEAAAIAKRDMADYEALHRWSIEDPEAFWQLIWNFTGVVGEPGERVLENGDKMPGAQFFPDAKLSFAENLLKHTGPEEAMVFRGEDKVERRMSWDDLHALVSRLQQLFETAGVTVGDRVAAMMPNMPETVAVMLAASSLGAIFSSCSPDFGEQGVLDRFGQIEPTIFVAPDGYWYNGKAIDVGGKVAAIAKRLPSARKVLIVDYLGRGGDVAAAIPNGEVFEKALSEFAAKPVRFTRLPFAQPLYILFSSGTTGIPKCIVHAQGGVLLQHVKEHQLHGGIEPGDRFFHYTTCGWMMWNWLVSGLASGATLVLYDGSPFYPGNTAMFDLAEQERLTYFGTSAKFIDAARKAGLRPSETHDLSALKTLSSTGSPLSPEGFDFVYDGIKKDVHLASMSGGTDLCACFVIGIPIKPVWSGEIQGPAIGMATDVWNDEGQHVVGEKGELVCPRPFPSMPVMFWADPDGRKYHDAYFDRFPNVWCHGDFAEWTNHGGLIIHGRSDATLNPGGVRIGTAEIYNVVEQMDEVVEALCIGQNWDNDVRVVLFVRLAEGLTLDAALEDRIKAKVRSGATPRHVPAKVVQVGDIPRTKSGKIVELAVRQVVHGDTVRNKEALANPEALELFRDRQELAS